VASSSPYVELHCHSAYSFLDGVSLPEELAQRAGELGYEALALTDHNSVSGSMELAVLAKEHGVRAIHGAEIDVAVDGGGPVRGGPSTTRHVTLLVRDERGWSNLCRIITLAHAHTRDGPRRSVGGGILDEPTARSRRPGRDGLLACAGRAVGRAGGGAGPCRGSRMPDGVRRPICDLQRRGRRRPGRDGPVATARSRRHPR